jgi:hypothetical protein
VPSDSIVAGTEQRVEKETTSVILTPGLISEAKLRGISTEAMEKRLTNT